MKKRIDGMNMTEAWNAAGVQCRNARSMGWWAQQQPGIAVGSVFTLWLESPNPLFFEQKGKNYEHLILKRPEALEDRGAVHRRKFESYWDNLTMLASKQVPVRIMAIKRKRDMYGNFLPGEDGNTLPLWLRDYRTQYDETTRDITLIAEDSVQGSS